MIRSLTAAASGMQAQQSNVDTIANNLANVNTNGFKRSQVMFQDMLYDTVRQPGGAQASGLNVPSGMQMGLGTRMVASTKVFSEGNMIVTSRDLDVAIQGEGFFRVLLPDGTLAYTRDGAFSKNVNGKLVTADGFELDGAPALSSLDTSVSILNDGTVSEMVNGVSQEKGTIPLYRFVNPSGLQAIGKNLFEPTIASGDPQQGNPGKDDFGTLNQGALETSNVDVVEEMVRLIVAQRAYEMNTKAVQASDEMLQATNNLKR
ncbi:MAG: flagellar basal-body rod protein FlgG [Planctomycetota bacterium]